MNTATSSGNGWLPFVGVRLVRENRPAVRVPRIRGPRDVAAVARELIDPDEVQECFCLVALDTQNRPIAAAVVSRGILNSSLVHPREVFQRAILAGAASIIVAHNHPSGDAEPSPEDLEVTAQLVAAGLILGIPVRDHVILGTPPRYVSLLERGALTLTGALETATKITAHERPEAYYHVRPEPLEEEAELRAKVQELEAELERQRQETLRAFRVAYWRSSRR